MVDADGDTKIQVEESSDEDIIRFDAGGEEVARMQHRNNECFFDLVRRGVPAATANFSFDGTGLKTNTTSGYVSLIVQNDGYERFRITGSGNVGIGESSPSHKLQVNGNIRADGHYYVGGDVVINSSRIAKMAYGTAAAPSYTFNGDDNLGMYRVAADTLGFTTGGTNRVVLDSSNFDIESGGLRVNDSGNNYPFAVNAYGHVTQRTASITQLNATGDHASVPLSVLADVASTRTASYVEIGDIGSAGNRFKIDSSGNVGVGTTSPISKLHLADSSANSIVQTRFVNDARDYALGVHGGLSDSFVLYDDTADATRLVVTTAGNVGIGTTSPSSHANLHIAGSAYAFLALQATATGGRQYELFSYASDESFHLYDRTATAYRVTVDETGNFGIGTTTPGKKLDVVGTIRSIDASSLQHQLRSTQLISYGTDAIVNAQSAGDDVRLNTQSSTVLIATAEGKVGIGTTAPNEELHVAASAADIRLHSTGSGTASRYILQTDDQEWRIGTHGGLNDSLWFYNATSGAYQMSLSTTGDLGLGVAGSTPTERLTVSETSSGNTVKIASFVNPVGAASTGVQLWLSGTNSTTRGTFITAVAESTSNDHTLRFGTSAASSAPTERMRINGSGDWMVSNTVANVASYYNNQGGCGWIDSDHHFEIATTTNRSSLELGRNNANDGDIITFRKQATVIGTIGVFTDDLNIGTGDTTLQFQNGNNRIVPRGTVGAQRDNAISLGSPGNRFHDAYFGGTVNVGENLVVTGDLTINGTTTTVNTATLNVEDKNITLNYGTGNTTSTADGAGITIQDAVDSSTDATILWDASTDRFDFSHDIQLPDNVKLVAGTGEDLQIFHDGSNSFITDAGTGGLYLRGSNFISLQIADGSETMIYAAADGAVQLKFNNSTKFATTSGGAAVTGNLTVSSEIDVSGDLNVGDSEIGTASTSTSATTQVNISSFSASSFRSAKYLVQVTNSTDSTYHFTEISIIHDGTDTYMTEVGSMFTGAAAEATFTSDISSGSVRLLATPASTDSMTFKVSRQAIAV